MADGITQLKELLFDREAATLADLARKLDEAEIAARETQAELADRISAVEESEQRDFEHNGARIDVLQESGQRQIAELAARLDQVSGRIGTPAALRRSVAEVIDDAIVDARENRYDPMARAVAPLVINTVKAELRNNQEEMIELLYPITGRLVKSYVASAIKDMMTRMNRSLEVNPAMLRIRSLLSGYSMAELRLADSQRLEVEELYLIRRGSGALIARWPPSPRSSNSDVHMSGVLTAINDFSAHAFQTDGGNLRSFALDDFTMFLRASPVYLLAAKCRGTAVSGVEELIDAAFVETVSRHRELEDIEHQVGGTGAIAKLLGDLEDRLEGGIAARHERLARAGMPFRPLRAITALLVLAVLSGGGWYGWTSYEVARTRATAGAVIDAAEGVKGFPMILDVGYRGRSLTLSGLAPSAASKSELMERLRKALPEVEVLEKGLAVLPPPPPDVRPQIAAVRRDVDSLEKAMAGNLATMDRTVRDGFASLRATVRQDVGTLETRIAHQTLQRSIDRAVRKLSGAAPDLRALSALADARRRETGARALDAVMRATTALGERRSSLGDATRASGADPGLVAPLDATAAQLRSVADSLASIVDGEARGVANRAGDSPRVSANAQDAAEALAVAAERIAATAAAAVQATAIRIPPPPPPGYRPSPRDLLVAFARSNAVFFGNGDAYRDESAAKRVLDALADHIKATRVLVRVVGYTDDRGGIARNSELGQARADKVVRELVERGVPQDMVVAVGRGSMRDISTVVGEQSANRRVEFEVGFEGEAARP